MEFNITYQGESFELSEDFIDVGYMAENVVVKDLTDTLFEIKRSHQDKAMTLLISLPDLSDSFLQEALRIDGFMSEIQVSIHCYFIFDKKYKELESFGKQLKKFGAVYDYDDEFGNMYGTKIVSGSLEDKLTKALFLISKDGAIFYLDMQEEISTEFDLTKLQVELNKAYVSYTGTGCHG
jgi:peroxiredoxin